MTELQEARKDGFHSFQEEEFQHQCRCCHWWYAKPLDFGLCSLDCPSECDEELKKYIPLPEEIEE